MRFEVWAPLPEQVELVLGDERRVPMERDDSGWWRVDIDGAGAGTRYGFSLDGGAVRPDPRSPHQPEGIDALSEVVDHSSFAWTDHTWRGIALPGAVLYELHVGTFSPEGTFEGAIARLPHLVDLGVDAIEVLPVAEFSGDRGWGYDGVDPFAPHHAYGGPAGLKRLVDVCHAQGLGVVIDVVYNHLGPAGNHLAEYGPYFTDRHHTPWGDAVNFDGPGAEEVRRFVVDNALMWLRDYHCDGLRLDAVHAIVDESPLHILQEIAAAVDALGAHLAKPLFVIAENDTNDPRLVRSIEAGGYGLDAAWTDDWHHALHTALTGESSGYYADFVDAGALPMALRHAWVREGRGSPAGLPPSRFVVCTQNHDQVGNRATGERSAALMSEGRLQIAAALLLTSPFIPMLFQGEEWAASSPFQYFTDHRDRDLGRAVSDGRRSEFASFGWSPEDVPDPQDPSTFERSVLRWDELDEPAHRRMLEWYRSLIRLRRTCPELTDPRLPVTADLDDGLLLVQRGSIRLAANLGAAKRDVDLGAEAEVLDVAGVTVDRSTGAAALPVDSVVIWQIAR